MLLKLACRRFPSPRVWVGGKPRSSTASLPVVEYSLKESRYLLTDAPNNKLLARSFIDTIVCHSWAAEERILENEPSQYSLEEKKARTLKRTFSQTSESATTMGKVDYGLATQGPVSWRTIFWLSR